jgi:hypothetical protein
MSIGSWSGGIVLLVAAVLWLVYLVPSWHARRQYLATERNAIRLQQTLRILAQTAELPEEVRVEMNAKSLAEAQRVAASEEARRRAIVRAHEAARQREITRRLAEQAPELERYSSAPALTAMRMRRSRFGATCLGFVGLVVAIVTLVVAPGMWLLALAGVVAVVGSVVVLGQLAAVARARARRTAGVPVQVRRASRPASQRSRPAATPEAPSAAEATADRSWTPTELPRPLYATGPDVARARAEAERAAAESSAALAARLRQRVAAAAAQGEAEEAAARAEAAAIRAGETDPGLARVTPLHADVDAAAEALSSHDQSTLAERFGLRASEPAASSTPGASAASAASVSAASTPSRWASMGLLDAEEYERPDVDAALRRRRVV